MEMIATLESSNGTESESYSIRIQAALARIAPFFVKSKTWPSMPYDQGIEEAFKLKGKSSQKKRD